MPIDPQVALHYSSQKSAAAVNGPLTLKEIRANADKIYNDESHFPNVYKVNDLTIPSACGGVSIRVYYPNAEQQLPVLLYFHGGGFVMHNIASHDSLCRKLCCEFGGVIVNVGYRLTPETPYPGFMDDAWDVLNWVSDHADDLGVDRSRIAVGGDSAGAIISAGLSTLSRDRKGPKISLQFLCYGSFGCLEPEESESLELYGNGGYVLTKEFLNMAMDAPDADGKYQDDPYLHPGKAVDLKGLPKTYSINAEYDPLRDDGEMYAKKLIEAGNDVTLWRVEGLMHGFLLLWQKFDKSQLVISKMAEMFRETFGL